MTDSSRRGFMKNQVGAGTALAVGLATGGAVGAGGMRTYERAQRPYVDRAALSYAQHGEDLVLLNILQTYLGVPQIAYLDIGAHEPILYNNTFLFYERGHRGVLVEPNPDLWGMLSQTRPGDVLVQGGIGVEGKDTEADFYVVTSSRLNTFSKEEAEKYAPRTEGKIKIEKVLRLPLLDVNRLMEKHWNGPPHVVSLDVEGFELPILKSIDWKRYRPPVLCIETLGFGMRRVNAQILELMAAQGYEVRGGSFVNTIFVDRRFIG
jgi:FkbM family methyltransferase